MKRKTIKKSKERRSGATEEQVKSIWKECDKLIDTLTGETGLSKFQVAKEVHYRIQRASDYRINPTEKQKQASLKMHGDGCWKKGPDCTGKKDEFHHLKRDIDNPHNADNMVPVCKNCHKLLS